MHNPGVKKEMDLVQMMNIVDDIMADVTRGVAVDFAARARDLEAEYGGIKLTKGHEGDRVEVKIEQAKKAGGSRSYGASTKLQN